MIMMLWRMMKTRATAGRWRSGTVGLAGSKHLVSGALRGEDAVRDAACSFPLRQFEARGALVFDETGQL